MITRYKSWPVIHLLRIIDEAAFLLCLSYEHCSHTKWCKFLMDKHVFSEVKRILKRVMVWYCLLSSYFLEWNVTTLYRCIQPKRNESVLYIKGLAFRDATVKWKHLSISGENRSNASLHTFFSECQVKKYQSQIWKNRKGWIPIKVLAKE